MKALALLPLLAGCLEVPSSKGQECESTSDCNSAASEVCYQGLCYGDPPLGMYAATLSAPISREDLTTTEVPIVSLPLDGNLGRIKLETPVTFSGRIEAACPPTQTQTPCSTLSIGAQIRITRPSRFPGGPALRYVALAKADIPRGTDSFSIRIPRTQDGDPPYVITIDPEGGGDLPPSTGGKDPAQLVPPKRFELVADVGSEHQTYTLGTSSVQITGTLKDGLGAALTKYRVVALGRWDTNAAPTEVSTVHYSTDGTYSLLIADGVAGNVEIVAKSYGVLAPELHAGNISVAASGTKNLAQPTGIGSRLDFNLPIQALIGDGAVKSISGAHVTVTGGTDSSFLDATRAVVIAEAVSGDDGIAKLSVLDGAAFAGSYRIRVVPPAGSSAGVVFDDPLTLPPPTSVRLPARVAVSGTLVDTAGKPLADVSVSARRSLRFLWSLNNPDQSFLDGIPTATSLITPETGEFLLWIDPSVATIWGHYDLFFETPTSSVSPNWIIHDFEIPRVTGQPTINLGKVTIPDAARLRAQVVDANDAPVEGSALSIFRLSDNDSVCREVAHAPAECSEEANVLGHGDSEATGNVRLTLPRP